MNRFVVFLLFFFISLSCNAEIIQDEAVENINKNFSKAEKYTSYNFESTAKIPISLKFLENVKTEGDLYEGQVLELKVAKDVLYNNAVVIKRGTLVKSKVSIIITPGMNGIPASIILKDFKIDGVKSSRLTNEYEIFGQDRSLLVFPLKWALTILPPTGSLTNFIMGGHAKIKVKKPITIYYYPEWI